MIGAMNRETTSKVARMAAAVLLITVPLLCLLPSTSHALSASAGTEIVNTASVSWSDANGVFYGTASGQVSTVISGASLMKISKLESTDPVSMGGELVYTIYYENVGNQPASDVVITDYLSEHLSFQSASHDGVYDAGAGTVTWTIGAVDAFFSGALTVTALVNTPDDYPPGDPDTIGAGTVIGNTAQLSYPGGSDLASIDTTVGEGVSMVSSVTFDAAAVSPGGTVTFTVDYENAGNETATGVTIHVPIPPGTSYVIGSAPGAVFTGTELVWTIGEVEPGESGQVTFQVTASTLLDEGDSITANAAVGSNEEGFVQSDPAVTAITTDPFISLTKSSSPAAIVAGNEITYTLRAANTGTGSLTGVELTDTLPQDITLVDVDPAGSLDGDTLTWDIGTLAQGDQFTVTLTVKVDLWTERNKVTNQAVVVTDQTEPVSIEEETLIESASPGMAVQKLDGPDPVFVGNPIYYTIVLDNTGNIPLTGIEVRDQIPAKTLFISVTDGGQLTGDEVIWTVSRLEVGEEKQLQIVVEVDENQAAAGDQIQNSATVVSSESPLPLGGATTTVSERTDGVITFHDPFWAEAYRYKVGDMVYIQVVDLDQNADPAGIDTTTIDVVNEKTGDSESVTLTETGVNTGTFRASLPGGSGTAVPGDGIITMMTDSQISATYTDPLDAAPVSRDSVLIDPYGVVFDSVSGAMVEGAVVTMYWRRAPGDDVPADQHPDWPPAQINPYLTGADGKYEFPLVPANSIFYLAVQPPTEDYTFPTKLADGQLPAGFIIGNGSRGELFSLAPTDPPLNLDLPLDPPPGTLLVTKKANRREVSRGGYLTYTITVSHTGGPEVVAPVVGIDLNDIMPAGMQYLEGTTVIDGTAAADPVLAGGTLSWPVRDLADGDDPVIISYDVMVGSNTPGGKARNAAYALGQSVFKDARSNTASFTVLVNESVFTRKGTILGRVFVDTDGNRLHNVTRGPVKTGAVGGVVGNEKVKTAANGADGSYSSGADTGISPSQALLSGHGGGSGMTGTVNYGSGIEEPGLEGIVLFLEDGTRVITDRHGKFSIPQVEPGTHVIRIDQTSLPPGHDLVVLNNRFMDDPESQFVDMTPGGLFKANFAVTPLGKKTVAPAPIYESESGEVSSQTEKKYSASDGPYVWPSGMKGMVIDKIRQQIKMTEVEGLTASLDKLVSEPSQPKLEELIKTMTPELEILSPAAGVLARRHQDVLVKTRFGNTVRLMVNGREIDAGRIGRTVSWEGGGVVLYEFISVNLLSGTTNRLTVQNIDPWGNLRETLDIPVPVAGSTALIEVTSDNPAPSADGVSLVTFTAHVKDRNGYPVTHPYDLTVTVSHGEVVDEDIDPMTGGVQVPCKDGKAVFKVLAPREPGESVISLYCDGVEEEHVVYFIPHLRDLLVVGVGEFIYGNGRKTSGDLSEIAAGRWFDDGVYQGGRGALFVKGHVGKGYLVTATYDSKREKRDELFRQSETRVDAEEKYPLYGDESSVGYESMSRGKLFARLEKDRSYLMFGDYHTKLTDVTLGAYRRSFNGYKTEVDRDGFKLQGFAAYTDQTQVVDTIQGRGVSGFYQLTTPPVLEGSERVYIETRHRRQIERVLKRDTMTRFTDYHIDYETGTILFKAPVPARDSELNPVYVVVSYESTGGDNKYYIYGGRAAKAVTDRLEVGFTSLTEEQEAGDFRLSGLDLTLDLPAETVLKAEWVETASLFTVDGLPSRKTGSGWNYSLQSTPNDRLTVSGTYRTTSRWFGNRSAVDAMRGVTRTGIQTAYELSDTTVLTGDFMDEKDRLNDNNYRRSALGVTKKYTNASLTLELAREKASDRYVPRTSADSRDPLDVSEETPSDLTSASLRYERQLNEDLGLTLQHKQDVEDDRHNLSLAELDYRLDDLTKLYLRQAYATFEGRREERTVMGVESKVAKDTVAFSEYRLMNGADGARNQQSIGLRNKFRLKDNLTGSISLENLNTLSGTGRRVEMDSLAVAAALEYLPRERVRWTSRLEYMDGSLDRTSLAELGLAYALDTDYTLMLKKRYYTDVYDSGGEQSTDSTLLGVAYRPVQHDRFNGLFKLEHKRERTNTTETHYVSESFLHSLEGIYQVNRRLQLSGKYAGKRTRDSSYAAYLDLVGGRMLYDLTRRIDFSAEYRLQTNHTTDTELSGGALELGVRVQKNLWVSFGYSFDEFDPDLTGTGYQGEGPYVRFRFKFNEGIFGNRKHGRDNVRRAISND